MLGLVGAPPAHAARHASDCPGLPAAVALRGVLTFAFFAVDAYVSLLLVEFRGLSLVAGRHRPSRRPRSRGPPGRGSRRRAATAGRRTGSSGRIPHRRRRHRRVRLVLLPDGHGLARRSDVRPRRARDGARLLAVLPDRAARRAAAPSRAPPRPPCPSPTRGHGARDGRRRCDRRGRRARHGRTRAGSRGGVRAGRAWSAAARGLRARAGDCVPRAVDRAAGAGAQTARTSTWPAPAAAPRSPEVPHRVRRGASREDPRDPRLPEAGHPLLRHHDAAQGRGRVQGRDRPDAARRTATSRSTSSSAWSRAASSSARRWPTSSDAGLVPVRKLGKLPAETLTVEYALEYGSNTLEIHRDAIQPGQKVLIVDDLLATGGTVKGTIELVERLKGEIVGLASSSSSSSSRAAIGSTAAASPASSSTDGASTVEPRGRRTPDRPDREPGAPTTPSTDRRRRRRSRRGADVGRRRFFRQFAGELLNGAATVAGAAQALQRALGGGRRRDPRPGSPASPTADAAADTRPRRDRLPHPVPVRGRTASCSSSTSAGCPTRSSRYDAQVRGRGRATRSARWSSAARRRSARSPRSGWRSRRRKSATPASRTPAGRPCAAPRTRSSTPAPPPSTCAGRSIG